MIFYLLHKQFRFILPAALVLAILCSGATAKAVDIQGVQPAAFDLPRMNGLLQPAGGGNPYNFQGDFNIQGFLDTGTSGIVINTVTSGGLNIPVAPGVKFQDVAIGGTTDFDVSQPVNLRLAAWNDPAAGNLNNFQTVYNQAFNGVRLQVGPTNVPVDPAGEPLDIYGMPTMLGKVVVMDPKPINDLSDFTMYTYLYEPNTPYNPNAALTNPGIPSTSHHVQLSYGDFSRFTQTTPDGSAGPNLAHNPMIGPDPTATAGAAVGDNSPPISVNFLGHHAEGTFLLDTGASASFISSALAEQLHVRYVPGSEGSINPRLETFDPLNPGAAGTEIGNQFQFSVQGIGGTGTVSGFFLDDMILHTLEGGLLDSDPNNIRFVGAPVAVLDVTVENPLDPLDTLTLDGIFGMNFMIASAMVDLSEVSAGPFSWVTFDEPNGILGLDLIAVPEPSSLVTAGLGLVALVGYRWRRRRSGAV